MQASLPANAKRRMRFVFFIGGLLFGASIVAIAIWMILPLMVASRLEASLGKVARAEVLKEAEVANRKSLDEMIPIILVDVPAASVVPFAVDAIKDAAAKVRLPESVTLHLRSDPTVTFSDYAVAIEENINVNHSRWGSVTIDVKADAIPKMVDGELVVTMTIVSVHVRNTSALGFVLPSNASDMLEKIVSRSLDALNTQIKPTRVPVQFPAEFAKASATKPAILVSAKAISILLGQPGAANGEGPAPYKERFIASAKSILANYEPGQGIIAFGNNPTARTGKLIDATNAMRDQATAENLASAERLLGITAATDPQSLQIATFAPTMMASISSEWLATKAKAALLKIAADQKPNKIRIDLRPDGVAVHILDGVIELSVSGSASFAKDVLKVDFAVSAWGTLHPEPGKVVVEYARRRVDIRRVTVNWQGRQTALNIPYSDALGELLSGIVGQMPKTALDVPPVPLKFETPSDGVAKLALRDTKTELRFLGRSVLLSPRRIIVLAEAALTDEPEASREPAAPGDAQFQRLEAIAARGEQLLGGGAITDSAAVLIGKAGLAALTGKAWSILDPRVTADYKDESNFDAGKIKLIPGNASCGNACERTENCGDLKSCTINFCEDVVVGSACRSVCPFVCDSICAKITNRVCGSKSNQSCVDKFNSCVSGAAECVARWTSGLQATCEATLAGIKGTGFDGVAEVSGAVSVDAHGNTFKSSALKIAPDLSAASLTIQAVAHADVDAHVDVTFIDFGNFFGCVSGRVSASPKFTAALGNQELSAHIAWNGDGKGPLNAVISIDDIRVAISTAEPPLVTFLKDNPGLLACPPLSGVFAGVYGLTPIVGPSLPRETFGGSIRAALPGEKGKLAAAIIDGTYDFEVKGLTAQLSISPFQTKIMDVPIEIVPRMTENAVVAVIPK